MAAPLLESAAGAGGGADQAGCQPSALALLTPSALTLAALCCGMSAVREAIRGDFSAALVCLGASAICDGLDGHAARRLNAVTPFGGELDSLCDLVDFGAAPALIVFEWATQWDQRQAAQAALSPPTAAPPAAWARASDNAAWAAALLYVCCAAYRLARFNVGALRLPHPGPGPAAGAVPPARPPAAAAAAGGRGAGGSAAHPQAVPPRAFSAPHIDLGGSQAERTEAFATTYVSRAKFFRGVPAPQGALMAVAPVVLWLRRAAALAAAGGGGGAAGAAGGGGGLQWSAEAWPFPASLPARPLAALWLSAVGCLMVTTWPMLSSKMAMRDPAVESHIRSASAASLCAKAAGGAALAWTLASVRSWGTAALGACALAELGLLLSVPLGPIAHRLARS